MLSALVRGTQYSCLEFCMYVRTYFRCHTCLRIPCTYVYVCMYVCIYTHMRTWVHVSCMRWASHESYTHLHTHIRMFLHIVLLWHDAWPSLLGRARWVRTYIRTCMPTHALLGLCVLDVLGQSWELCRLTYAQTMLLHIVLLWNDATHVRWGVRTQLLLLQTH